MLIINKNQSKLAFLMVFTLIVALIFTGCDGGVIDDSGDQIDDTYNLTIEVKGEGTTEPEPGNHDISDDKIVDIKALPYYGYKFSKWEGDVADSNNAETTVIIDEDKTVIAYFSKEEEKEPVNPGEMVLVEAGSKGGITIDNDFYIGKFHVTQAEFKDVMGFNPSYFNDDDHSNLVGNSDNRPVERVTWYDAFKYANELSKIEELDKYYNISDIRYDGDNIISATVTRNMEANGYRLPTRKEHEYAARGGRNGNRTTYSGSNNLDEVGWYRDNSDTANSDRDDNKGTMPVGEKKSNELGIYDMSGNVWDWTSTELRNRKIKRGDSWIFGKYLSEVHYIYVSEESKKFLNLGFRLARNP